MNFSYKTKWRLLLSSLFVVTSFGAFAQTQFPVAITAGTQGNTNGGTGTATDMDPTDLFYNSFRYQTVYTVAELNAAGVYGGKITSMGWFTTQIPSSSLKNYTIKMGHTTAANAATYNADVTTTVKNPFSFLPATNTAYNDIALDAPFIWNGTSNLLIEVCSSGNTSATPYGGVRGKTGVANSANFVGGSTAQCGVATTTATSFRPYVRLTIENPATPPAPVQAAGTPTCITGSSLTVAGTAPAGETWYWQTTATGTSMTTPVSGAYAISDNGTYYVNSYSTASHLWSAASSITVSNFIHPAAPGAITQVTNPACITTGTDLTVAAPASPDEAYYWQGTTNNGISQASPATAPYHAASSGTYYVNSYNAVSGCWSNTSTSLAVTVNSYIPPAPAAATSVYTICTGTPGQQITATLPAASGSVNPSFGTNLQSSGIGTTTYSLTMPALPAGATITSASLQLTNVNAINFSWRSEIRVGTSGIYTQAATQIANQNSQGLVSPNPTINLAGFSATGGGVLNLLLTETYDDEDVIDATFGEVKLLVNYTLPASTISWFDASTAGTQLGTGSPFETVGTAVLPNTGTSGSYNFYAQANSGGCASTSRTQVSVNVSAVLATLVPVAATCNGLNNGSFTLGTVQCGTSPFTYSVDGGAYGAIPANLTAGSHEIIIKDANNTVSSPLTIIITEPAAPTGLTADASYYTATLGWTAQGDETDWVIEWGPTGFTPGTGTIVDPATNPYTITGLSAATAYQYYVAAGCAPGSDFAGPFAFTTDSPFTIFDSECGPGFTDISETGTLLDFSGDVSEFFEDEAETGVTLPFTWNFQGLAVNTISVGYNGGVALNTLTGEVESAMLPSPGLSLYSMDLDVSEVYTQTVGVAPNRQFIVQWTNAPAYLETNGATFQLVIQESSSDYFFLYDDVIMEDEFESYGADAEIGVSGPLTSLTVSSYDNTYLTSHSCVRFTTQLCPNPTNLVISPNETDADLSWTAGAYGETNWTVIYGPAGFDPASGTGDTAFATSNTVNLFPLDQNTEYDVYIYSECSLDNLVSEGLMGNFTTVPFCATPTSPTAATDVDSLEAAWNWTVNPNYAGYTAQEFAIQYGPVGFTPGNGIMYTANGTDNADTVVNSIYFLAGGVYQYYVQAVCGDNDSVSGWAGPVSFTMPLSNDLSCGAETLPVDGIARTFNNTGATVSLNETSIAPPATGAQTTTGWINQTLNGTVWFKFTAPASGNVRVNATGINYNGQAAVYAVNDCANFVTYELQAANDNAIGGTSLAPNFTICGLTSGTDYYLMFDAFSNTFGNYSLAISAINLEAGFANTTPAILNVCSGTDVDLFNTINGQQAGGSWSSAIPVINGNITGSTLSTAGLAYTTYDLQYRVTDGCAYDSVLGKVKIFAPSNAGTNGSITACRNQQITLFAGLTGTADLGGTWYTPAGAVNANGSYVTTPNIQGNYNYTYIAGNGVCPNDTALVVVNVGSCNILNLEEQVFSGVEVFPNPSAGIVFVTSDISFSYEVTDANGRVVTAAQNGVKAAQKTEINLSDVERGVYFIRLNNEDAQKTYRVVIN